VTQQKTIPKRQLDAKTFLLTLACLLPVAMAATWSVYPSIKSAVAVTKFEKLKLTQSELGSEETITGLKRQIQRHFLDYSVYIPTEDIVVLSTLEKSDDRLESLMTKACGRGSLFVWIPVKISLPFYGEKVRGV
jgi:hypothetical protein